MTTQLPLRERAHLAFYVWGFLAVWIFIAIWVFSMFEAASGLVAVAAAVAWLATYSFVLRGGSHTRQSLIQATQLTQGERSQLIKTVVAEPLRAIAFLLGVLSVTLFAWQVLVWLRTASWPCLDILTLTVVPLRETVGPQVGLSNLFYTTKQGWMQTPQNWIGLHMIFMIILKWTTVPGIGLLASIFIYRHAAENLDLRRRMVRWRLTSGS